MATYWENSCSFGLRYVSWYKYLIVSLVFSHLGFWSGSLFLIAPFPDLCLLVPFYATGKRKNFKTQWESHLLFCVYFDLSYLPTTTDILSLYSQFLIRSLKSVQSIKNYLSGVKTLNLIFIQLNTLFLSLLI